MSAERPRSKRVRKPPTRRSLDNENTIRSDEKHQKRVEEVLEIFRLPSEELLPLIAEEHVAAQELADRGQPFAATISMEKAALYGIALIRAELRETQPPPVV